MKHTVAGIVKNQGKKFLTYNKGSNSMKQKIIVICPMCHAQMNIDAEQKNTCIKCSECSEFFMAYEAVKCARCGRFYHPTRVCKCAPLTEVLEFQSDRAMAERSWKNPFSWQKILEQTETDQKDPFLRGAGALLKSKIEADEKQKKEMADLFRSLPENIQAILKYETDKYEKLLTGMRERIEKLEDTVSDLESEIEELKEKNE